MAPAAPGAIPNRKPRCRASSSAVLAWLKTQAHHATGDIEPGAAFDTEPMVILAVSAWLSKTHAARFLGFWDAAAHDQSELLINNEEKQRDIKRAWARYPAYPAALCDGQ